MDKIKCPHCGAINQDVTEQDTCWNCSKPLSAASVNVNATSVTTNVSGTDTPPDSTGKRLKTQPTLEERVEARKLERAAGRRSPVVPLAIALIVILLALLIYYFVFLRHP